MVKSALPTIPVRTTSASVVTASLHQDTTVGLMLSSRARKASAQGQGAPHISVQQKLRAGRAHYAMERRLQIEPITKPTYCWHTSPPLIQVKLQTSLSAWIELVAFAGSAGANASR